MAGLFETVGAATGNKDLENMGKNADKAIEDGVNKGKETVENAYKGGKAAVDGAVEFGTTVIEVIGGTFPFPNLEDILNPPVVENPENSGVETSDTETPETEDADSLLAGVDLFDFDSLDEAIARGQEMIANGEGSAQLFGELQLLLQSQMQMVSLISNMQKVQHDTAMAAINNIR